MALRGEIRRRLRLLARRKQAAEELAEEIEAHLAMKAAEEGERNARREFGNATRWREISQEAWGWSWLESLWQDVRFGWRLLVKNPGLTATAGISLALGLGGTTAMFSLMNALLFKALPVAAPERLAIVTHQHGGTSLSYPQFRALQADGKQILEIFAYAWRKAQLRRGDLSRNVYLQPVSGNYYQVLGIQPEIGRLLAPSDDRRAAGGSAPVVISHRLWASAFDKDSAIVGQKILLDGVPFVVAGVTPERSFGVEPGGYPDVTLPFAAIPVLDPNDHSLDCRNCYWLTAMGRLRPGVSMEQANAGLRVAWSNVLRETVPGDLPERFKKQYYDDPPALLPGGTGNSNLRAQFGKPLYVLLAMTGLILLISCGNIANLLLTRAQARQREVAVRLSIGARPARLVRQLLTESALLAMLGAAGGLVVYELSVSGLIRFLSSGGDEVFLDTNPDFKMALFAVGVTVLSVLLFGLFPALRAARRRVSGWLAESSQTIAARSRTGKLILVFQLALSFVLLTGALLLARSLHDLRTFDAGFRRDHLLIVSPETAKQMPDFRDKLRFVNRVLEEARRIPGVRAASGSAVVPMEGSSEQTEYVPDGYVWDKDKNIECYANQVNPGFFETMGTRMLAGRDFTERDDAKSLRVAIVNESFARYFWGNDDAVGKRVHEPDRPDRVTVVGVVRDVAYRDFRKPVPRTIYLPLAQAPSSMGWDIGIEIWTSTNPLTIAPEVRQIIRGIDKAVPVKLESFNALIDQRLLNERILTALAECFGGLALLISAVGVYGIAAYSTARRTVEVGIRMALGATRGGIVKLMLGEHLPLTCVGLAAGLAGTFYLARFLEAWLFGVNAKDLASLLLSVLFLGVVTGLATFIPAYRAARIEPLRALRHE